MDIHWSIERLGKSHERAEFDCGNAELNNFLKTLASQYERKRLGRTYVACRDNERQVAGFYTVSAHAIAMDALPEANRVKLARHPVPSLHLGRLAVDRTVQRSGLGTTLLFHFLAGAFAVSKQVGLFTVDFIAQDESAKGFYRRHGFAPLASDQSHLFLPLATIEQMFKT